MLVTGTVPVAAVARRRGARGHVCEPRLRPGTSSHVRAAAGIPVDGPERCATKIILRFFDLPRAAIGPSQFLTEPRSACKCQNFVESTTFSLARLEPYDFQSGVTTYPLLMSASVAVPQLPIVIFSSYCKISRTLATPASPNDPKPHSMG